MDGVACPFPCFLFTIAGRKINQKNLPVAAVLVDGAAGWRQTKGGVTLRPGPSKVPKTAERSVCLKPDRAGGSLFAKIRKGAILNEIKN